MKNDFNLNAEGFETYLLRRVERPMNSIINEVQYIFKFENGYGASVLHFAVDLEYPSCARKWELAVIKFDETGYFRVVYDTPIADDIIERLDDKSVRDILSKIKAI